MIEFYKTISFFIFIIIPVSLFLVSDDSTSHNINGKSGLANCASLDWDFNKDKCFNKIIIELEMKCEIFEHERLQEECFINNNAVLHNYNRPTNTEVIYSRIKFSLIFFLVTIDSISVKEVHMGYFM